MTAMCYILAAGVVSTITAAQVRLPLLRLRRAHFVFVLLAFDKHDMYLMCGMEWVWETALALVLHCDNFQTANV